MQIFLKTTILKVLLPWDSLTNHELQQRRKKEGTWRIVFNKFTNYNQQALNQERRTKCLHLWKLHLPKLPQLPPKVMQHVRGWHVDLLVGSKLLFQFLLFHCLQIWNAFPLHGNSRNLRMELLLLLLDLLVSKECSGIINLRKSIRAICFQQESVSWHLLPYASSFLWLHICVEYGEREIRSMLGKHRHKLRRAWIGMEDDACRETPHLF